MTLKLKSALVMSASMLVLGACDGDSATFTTPPPVTPPVAVALEDRFGAGFGVLFRAAANTDPADPVASALIALDLTIDPVAVP